MRTLLLLFGLLVCASSSASNSIDSQLPLNIPSTDLPRLDEHVDPALQAALETRLNSHPRWRRLIANKKMAVGLVDLQDPMAPKFARVNGNQMMYAASLPKIAVLFTASQALADGTLQDTPAIRADMRRMISRSDNAAATRLIDKVGFAKIEATLTDPRYRLYDRQNGGGLWVGKRYAKTGRRIGDPLHNISHGATVTQVSRFYYLLATGNLVNQAESERMLACLVDPEIHHKFVNTLDHVAQGAKIYRKSGTWKDWHADSALVWGSGWQRYVIVGLVEDPRGEKILRELIYEVESALKNEQR